MAESSDGTALLVGEIAWTERPDPTRLEAEARRKAESLPLAGRRDLLVAVWTPAAVRRLGHFGPAAVLEALR